MTTSAYRRRGVRTNPLTAAHRTARGGVPGHRLGTESDRSGEVRTIAPARVAAASSLQAPGDPSSSSAPGAEDSSVSIVVRSPSWRAARSWLAAAAVVALLLAALAGPAVAGADDGHDGHDGSTWLVDLAVTAQTSDPASVTVFSAVWINRQGDGPDYIRVAIDGVDHDLAPTSDAPFRTGRPYALSTTLSPGDHSIVFSAGGRDRFTAEVTWGIVSVPEAVDPGTGGPGGGGGTGDAGSGDSTGSGTGGSGDSSSGAGSTGDAGAGETHQLGGPPGSTGDAAAGGDTAGSGGTGSGGDAGSSGDASGSGGTGDASGTGSGDTAGQGGSGAEWRG